MDGILDSCTLQEPDNSNLIHNVMLSSFRYRCGPLRIEPQSSWDKVMWMTDEGVTAVSENQAERDLAKSSFVSRKDTILVLSRKKMDLISRQSHRSGQAERKARYPYRCNQRRAWLGRLG